MISNNFIHIHITKCAGTSIEKTLNSKKLYDHRTVKQYIKILGKNYNKKFSFAFIRNPWDRMVSYYTHALKGGAENINIDLLEKAKNCNFKDFLLYKHKNIFNKKTSIIFMFRTYFEWLSINDEIKVDFIGKYENIDENWKKICKYIKIDKSLLKINEGKKFRKYERYQDYYDNETKDFVYKKFKKDIELFNYDF